MTTRRELLHWAAAGLIAAHRPAHAQAQAARPAGEADADLDRWLEAQRVAWRVPGLAVALVQDGRASYVRGFGFRDAAQTLPVTTDTLFRAGSTTKAWGAATVAMLVDEGKLAWDAPVTTYVPEFRMSGGGAEYAALNLRDMLSHRSGLPRHDLLWYHNQTLSRQGLVERLRHLDTTAPLRHRYQYNNLMYVLAALVVERVTGMGWEAFARDRLLQPLGLTRATLSVLDHARDANHAIGFASPAGARRPAAVPLRHDPLLGPAGALNLSIAECARWAQLQLGRGVFEGRRLISAAGMAAMWEPLVPVGGTLRDPDPRRGHVGLGWRIDRYRDTLRVAHGGDLNGFTSRVVLLPEKGAALVVLTNHGGHPLPNAVTPDLLDRLLGLVPEDHASAAWARRHPRGAMRGEVRGEAPAPATASSPVSPVSPSSASSDVWPSRAAPAAGSKPVRALAAYAGTYAHRGYGWMTVTAEADGLAVRYNDMPAALLQRGPDEFETRARRSEHEDFSGLRLVFPAGDAGRMSGFSALLQEGVPPILFARVD